MALFVDKMVINNYKYSRGLIQIFPTTSSPLQKCQPIEESQLIKGG